MGGIWYYFRWCLLHIHTYWSWSAGIHLTMTWHSRCFLWFVFVFLVLHVYLILRGHAFVLCSGMWSCFNFLCAIYMFIVLRGGGVMFICFSIYVWLVIYISLVGWLEILLPVMLATHPHLLFFVWGYTYSYECLSWGFLWCAYYVSW